MRWPADPVGELLDVGEGDAPLLGLLKELDGGDLVAVLDQIGLPGLDDGAGPVGVDDAVGVDQGVPVDVIDDPVVRGPQFHDPLPQGWVGGDRLHSPVEEVLDGLLPVCGVTDDLGLGVGVNGVHEGPDDVPDWATGDDVELFPLGGGEVELELG